MIHRLAWQQLTHERLRLLAAVAGITFAVLLQLMQFGFRDALYTSSVFVHSRLQADIVLISAQYEYIIAPGRFPRRRLYEAMMLKDVESVAAMHMGLLPFKDPLTRQDRQVLCLAFSPDDLVFDLHSMNADGNQIRLADTLLFDAKSRQDFRPVIERVQREGVVVTDMAGRRVEITGLFELGVSFTGNPFVMTSDSTFRRLVYHPEGTIEVGLVRLKPGSDVGLARATLAAAMPPDVKVMTRQEFADLELSYWDKTSPIGFIFSLGLFVGLLVGAVIVYQILYTDVTEHLAEYATLKAMGYRDRSLQLVVMQEAVILSVLGFPVGLLLAQGLYAVTRRATGLPMVMTGARVVLVFGLILFMCTLSGLLARRKLKSADPADAF